MARCEGAPRGPAVAPTREGQQSSQRCGQRPEMSGEAERIRGAVFHYIEPFDNRRHARRLEDERLGSALRPPQ